MKQEENERTNKTNAGRDNKKYIFLFSLQQDILYNYQ